MDEIIGDKYEIIKLIGCGGMSKVYLAMDIRFNKCWAIKEIPKTSNKRNMETIVNSLLAEANILKRMDHPSIPRIVDIFESDLNIYIVMDYIEGKTLETVLREQGAQQQELVIEWAIKLCEVLEYLHTRQPPIIYRDMKPANIILCPNGNLKLIDFGIAREYKEGSISDTICLGTRGYAAPEQFGGKGQTDVRTDIYCLGVTLHYLVTGHNPCESPCELYPIRQCNPKLSLSLESIIAKCVQLNPDNRYQSCRELIFDLHYYREYGCLYQKRNATNILFSIMNIIWCKIVAYKSEKYINEDEPNYVEERTNIDDAQYIAKVFANIQNDERNCTTLKGPDYNE